MKKLILFFAYFYSLCIFADTPPQLINKTCSTHQWFSQIQQGSKQINCTQPSYSDLSGSAPGGAWGSITGTLSNQTDLQTALNAKQSTLTFSNSLVNTSGTVTLLNDSASPGANKYYGTNAGNIRSYYAFPAPTPGGSSGQLQYNNAGVLAGATALNYTNSSPFLSVGFSGQHQINLSPSAWGSSSPMFYTDTYWNINGDGSASFASGGLAWDSSGEFTAAQGDFLNQLNVGSFFHVDGGGNTTVTALTAGGLANFENGLAVTGGSTSLDNGLITTDTSGNLTVANDVVAAYLQATNLSIDSNAFISGNFSSDGGNFASDGSGGIHFNTAYMGGYIQDASLNESIDPNNRILYTSGSSQSLDWQNEIAYYASGVGSIYYDLGQLHDTNGATKLTWSTSGVSVPNIVGTFTSYNGNSTVANGVSSVVAQVNSTAQTASIGSTALFTPASASEYRISVYLVTSTAGTSGTVTATIGWSDGIAARTAVTPTVTFGTLAAPVTLSQFIVTNTTNVTYLTTVTAAVGTPKYDIHIIAERLK